MYGELALIEHIEDVGEEALEELSNKKGPDEPLARPHRIARHAPVRSSLATVYIPAHPNNYRRGRPGKITKTTPHHMAGNLTVETCGQIFQQPGRSASSNYSIGTDGRIACHVDETDTAYTSSSYANDSQAITIEVANIAGAPYWGIGDKAWKSLVNLCYDICKRHNMRMQYDSKPTGQLTRHNMFAATTCPGPHLQGLFPELVTVVNALLVDEEKPVNDFGIYYYAHCQNLGTIGEGQVHDGMTGGTTGRGLRMERVFVDTSHVRHGVLELGMSGHAANIGKIDAVYENSKKLSIGSEGRSSALEGLVIWEKVNTTGYKGWVRMHFHNNGWSAWEPLSDTPTMIGSTGLSIPGQAIQIKYVRST